MLCIRSQLYRKYAKIQPIPKSPCVQQPKQDLGLFLFLKKKVHTVEQKNA
jgi:hypothetical protein